MEEKPDRGTLRGNPRRRNRFDATDVTSDDVINCDGAVAKHNQIYQRCKSITITSFPAGSKIVYLFQTSIPLEDFEANTRDLKTLVGGSGQRYEHKGAVVGPYMRCDAE